jgi:hypothetical protein
MTILLLRLLLILLLLLAVPGRVCLLRLLSVLLLLLLEECRIHICTRGWVCGIWSGLLSVRTVLWTTRRGLRGLSCAVLKVVATELVGLRSLLRRVLRCLWRWELRRLG